MGKAGFTSPKFCQKPAQPAPRRVVKNSKPPASPRVPAPDSAGGWATSKNNTDSWQGRRRPQGKQGNRFELGWLLGWMGWLVPGVSWPWLCAWMGQSTQALGRTCARGETLALQPGWVRQAQCKAWPSTGLHTPEMMEASGTLPQLYCLGPGSAQAVFLERPCL